MEVGEEIDCFRVPAEAHRRQGRAKSSLTRERMGGWNLVNEGSSRPMLALLVVNAPEREPCLMKIGRVAQRFLEKHDLCRRIFRDSAFDVLLEGGQRRVRTLHLSCRGAR